MSVRRSPPFASFIVLLGLLAMLPAAAGGAMAEPAAHLLPDSPGRTDTAWVADSNRNTALLQAVQARFNPENASAAGLTQYDGQAIDLGPGIDARSIVALQAVRIELAKRLAAEKDPRVRQDLQILIGAIDDEVDETRLEARHELRWIDVPKMMFGSLQALLQEQLPAARRAKALEHLQRYVGLLPGTTALAEQARARFQEGIGKPGLQGPPRARVDDALVNVPVYIKGIRELFASMKIDGAEPALAAMESQLNAYARWERQDVLPLARADFRLAPQLYAFRLKRYGIDIDPMQLVKQAEVEFMETRAAVQALAPVVVRQLGLAVADPNDYRAVITALKKNTIPNARLEAHYKNVNTQLEQAIRHAGIVDVPNRAMIMRLASEAESAAQPAPHMVPPPLIGNTGERGQFVLPVTNPSGGAGEAYDDFNFPGAAWTVSAHEGRPGHELQFSAMVEHGVSQARSLYAFNSVNVEGWALYAEAEMVPHEPADGQLIALQLRLLRAARAMLDPMLNLGLISREDAGRVLREDVMLSAPMVRQELDRYTLNAPGQAGSYFYGYVRILQLRAETELALGRGFNRLAFNNFLLDQGLLPPDLLAKAVRDEFIPTQKKRTVAGKG